MSAIRDLTEFFAAEAPRLRNFLRRFGPAVSVEDIAQDSFARLCASDLDTIVSPRAWLFRTARNLALNELKRARISPVATLPDLAELELAASQAPSPEDEVIASAVRERLNAVLAGLPERQRLALLLFKLEGLSHKEIGERLGVSHRTVERYIADAIACCYEKLAARED